MTKRRLFKEEWDLACKNLKTGKYKWLGTHPSLNFGLSRYAAEILDDGLQEYSHCDDIDLRDQLIGDFMAAKGKRAIKCGDYVYFYAKHFFDPYGNVKREPVIPELANESRKLVKEGAGAGYTVGISDLEIDEVTEVKQMDDGDYTFTAKIVPGTYEISAEDYYNDFFYYEHEAGINPEAQIDGGFIHGTICPWEDTDDPEGWVKYQVEGSTFNLSFMYSAGWLHSNLPKDGQLYIDERLDITPELYFSIDCVELDAPDLAAAVNDGYQSIFDRDEEEKSPFDESTGAAKINLTWDEFNKLCDLIDIDWNRWNKNNAKSIPMVADRAVEHLEWITNKRLKGLDPKDVQISYTVPSSGIDEYDTGTQNTETIYELIEGMAWRSSNPYNESDYAPLGRGKTRKPDDVIIKVNVKWGGADDWDSDEDVQQYLDDVGLPGTVYIKIPGGFWDEGNVDFDLSSKIGETFDGYVDDYYYHEVKPREVPTDVPIFLWRPETDIMEEF